MIMASTKDKARVKATTVATSLKKSPIFPSRKKNIEKAKIVVVIADKIGGITSIVPSIAAFIGDFPFHNVGKYFQK